MTVVVRGSSIRTVKGNVDALASVDLSEVEISRERQEGVFAANEDRPEGLIEGTPASAVRMRGKLERVEVEYTSESTKNRLKREFSMIEEPMEEPMKEPSPGLFEPVLEVDECEREGKDAGVNGLEVGNAFVSLAAFLHIDKTN